MYRNSRFGIAGGIFWSSVIAVALGGLVAAYAIEPTELEPAEGLDAGQFQLEIKGGYEDFSDGHETVLEAELSYGINENVRLGLNVPYEWEEDDSSFGDVGAFIEFVFNPESDGIVVGGELKLTAPTGEDSEGMGGEAQLRFSKYFAEGKHGLHLTLKGFYESVEDEDDCGIFDDDHDDHHDLFDKEGDEHQEFGYTAVLGYTFKPTDATTLIADVTFGEAAEDDENTNLVELGLTHEFSDAVEIGVGVGAGLDDDSPDFVAHAGIEFKFGGSK